MKLLLIYGIVLVLIELSQGTTPFDLHNKEYEKCTVLHNLQQLLNTDWSLSTLSDVKCLHMQNSNVEHLTNCTFNIFPNLQYLNLAGNNIQNRNLEFISRMQNLKTLVLDKAYRTSTPGEDEFLLNAESATLESLFLSNNGIKKLIISSKMHLENVTTLILNNNDIQEISTEVNGVLLEENFNWLPQSLKYLNIANNKLKNLIIINKTELFEVNAQWNELNTLTLENLPNLENLYIREKSLNQISIKNLPKLKDLTLELLNSERILLSNISDLPSLEELHLNCNNLLYFDGQIITHMPSLRTLVIENGSLTNIPRIQDGKNLINLLLSRNKIEELTSEDFFSIPNLEELNLSHNSIKNLESSTFSPLKNLRILNLEHNLLEIASLFTFNAFSNLEILKLSNNRLRFFDGIIVDNNPELIELDLGNNLLENFPTINNGIEKFKILVFAFKSIGNDANGLVVALEES
ncbi:leucine-rich repeat-containing G-protein coupled receptor 5-like [Leptopilina heterotoma]|uniref:leucine-rich repeat-containing G-protein coupled receptor 5-like n=1 Tax=Leptopilina heterotoma TaxID=63436 RepID=UPI001CA9D65E|nr:leucine-rich repeat-containing G-protein coupled receptor 5-like [Leptopilina heterotoma]